jgi:ankyrin repeat protein
LLDSLKFEQIDFRKMNIEKPLTKTCQWLLSHPSYKYWLNPAKLTHHHGFLWISGKPGAGKSTMMKFAYKRMRRKVQSKNTVTASFFFNARGEQLEEKSIAGMYRSLLLQLLEGYTDLQTVLDDPELVSHSLKGCPPLNSLKDIFYSAVSKLDQREFTCFVDALDECDEQQVVDMVQFFEDLTEQYSARGVPFRICFSSRHYPYIVFRRGIRLTLEDQPGHTKDLATYAANRLRIDDPLLAEELRTKLLDKASGVFMWVVLVVDILNKESRRGGMFLKRRLAEIPSGLSELFKNILRRDREDMKALLFCILWILHAKRPLRPKEFYHALWCGLSLDGIVDSRLPDVSVPDFNADANRFDRYVIHSSKGLAAVTKSETVQFIHESVRDFLIKDKGLHELWPDIGFDRESPGHEKLKQCCCLYMNQFLSGTSLSELSVQSWGLQKETLDKFPFLEYTGQYVFYHANIAAKEHPQDGFLSSFPLSHWIGIHNAFESYPIRRYSQEASLIYILADSGHSELVRVRLREEPQSCSPQESYKYPLFAALANGQKDTVAALLDLPSCVYRAIDLMEGLNTRNDFKGYKGRTPLSWAAQEGRDTVAQLLLHNGAAIDEMDQAGHTALSRASQNGYEAVARLLIERGADVNAGGIDGQTPLLLASKNGRVAVVKLLIERGADLNVADKWRDTPLLGASWKGHEAVVRLLIERGAEVNVADSQGFTPLLEASCSGYEAVARLLIERGAEVNVRSRIGWTPLIYASREGHEAVARLLIERGAEVNVRSRIGWTPLVYASRKGHEAVARLLIERGAGVNTADIGGYTPLSWASRNGHEAVIRLLIDNGAEIGGRQTDT